MPVLMLLSLVTLGAYPAFWYLRRQPFLDSLDTSKKLGGWAIALLFATWGLLLVVVVQALADLPGANSGLPDLVVGTLNVLVAFRVAAMLRSDFARTGRIIRISRAGVFFFGVLYLQHAINTAAGMPPRTARSA